MSKALGEIRQKIDSIDNQVHDLLMERASLVSSVASAKKKDGLQIVQPAREAMMMRRLLARHEGVLPRSTVVRIWRELVGSVALLQTGMSVAVACDSKMSSFWDMAKSYFGCNVPMHVVTDVEAAISEVRSGDVSFAALPWPADDGAGAWWSNLINAEESENLSVICALPYGYETFDNCADPCVVLSDISFMSSDDDVSFLGVALHSALTRDDVLTRLRETELDVLRVCVNGDSCLIEVRGYYVDNAAVSAVLSEAFGDGYRYCRALGGYPVVPDITAE